MRRVATLAFGAALLALPAFAQNAGNPAFMTPGTGAAQPNESDRNFARAAAAGGLAEIEFGSLAQQNARSEAVKGFGKRMVEDHGKASAELKGLAKEDGIPLPEQLDPEHIAIRDRLAGLSGPAFDQAYVAAQVADHQSAAQLLEYEIGAGQDKDLKTFAAEALPVVLEHLEIAQHLQADLAGKPK
jgi:putative membrane protein